MAKYELRVKAREKRATGMSVNDICIQLGLSKSTVSIWVRDVILTIEQLEKLRNKSLEGAERGRIKSAFLQKQKRLDLIEKRKEDGLKLIGELSDREILIAGIGLYWAEGSKMGREASFCNSDPKLVNFMIQWFEKCFGIEKTRIAVKVGINEIHRDRELKVKKFWSENTGISLSQFRKTSFKKVTNKKIYANFDDHYGTLEVKILKGSEVYYKIVGLIYGISRQGSSVVAAMHS